MSTPTAPPKKPAQPTVAAEVADPMLWVRAHQKLVLGIAGAVVVLALGAWLGLKMVLPIVLGASVIGAVVGIGMKLGSTLREGRYVPFGPFLAGAGLSVMLIGAPTVLEWIGWA